MFQGKINYHEINERLNGFNLEFHECAKFRFNWTGRNLHGFNRLFAIVEADGNSEIIHEESGKKYILQKDRVYFLSNCETYNFKFTEQTYFLSFHFNCYISGCREIFSDSKIFAESGNNQQWIRKTTDLMKENISIREYCQLYNSLCSKIIEFIPMLDAKKQLLYHRDMKIHRFLLHEADAETTIENLADIVGISADTLSRRFSQDYQKTLKKTIDQAVAGRAEKMLRDNELKIKEVAALLNFNDEYYFSKFFKRETGKSPSEFRQMIGIIKR